MVRRFSLPFVIQSQSLFLSEARDNPDLLGEDYPSTGSHIPVGDVFTSCNWVLRDGCYQILIISRITSINTHNRAPKSATKRVFLITDNDNPLASSHNSRLVTSARTTLTVGGRSYTMYYLPRLKSLSQDLLQAGVTIEPFFITTDDKPFNQHKFWSVRAPISCSCGPFLNFPLQSVLVAGTSSDEDLDVLPASLSISRIDDLLEQMRFHEAAKRALFSIPFELATGFIIGIKGYGLITEQKKGAYKYFADLGDKMEVVESHTTYVDEVRAHLYAARSFIC
jgi:ATP-dependent DNA helicase 2 subunit 1